MKLFYPSITALILFSAGHAAAQTPSLQPVQTIALGEHGALAGSVRLANHNTVLLLADAQSPTLRAQCLAPDGHTLWETTLDRYQRLSIESYLSRFSILNPLKIGGASGQFTRVSKKQLDEQVAALLEPVNVLTDGNQVLLVERIDDSSLGKQPKGSPLHDGQMYVQRLDEQGRLAKALFEPRPDPASKKTSAITLGHYAEATGYVEIVRESNTREETLAYCTMHYDLLTKTVRREPLDLPATVPAEGNGFSHWYQDWAYLGHRPNQTYFCRRTLVSNAQEKPGAQPISYQVYLADDRGAAAPGGFNTTLGLSRGTRPYYSGNIPSFGELDHVPSYHGHNQGGTYVSYDEWEASSGGVGSFYLDHGTGDVLIFGEYGQGDLPEAVYRPNLLGYFEHRYTSDGRLLGQVQSQYTEAMRAQKKNVSFQGFSNRRIRFHYDPLSGYSQYSFSPVRQYGQGEDFDLFIDHDLKMQRYEYLPGRSKDERLYTTVRFVEPLWLYKATGSTAELRLYEHAAPTDLPVYVALEKLRRAAAQSFDHEFLLSATGPGSGLVVERQQLVGGSLQVYKF